MSQYPASERLRNVGGMTLLAVLVLMDCWLLLDGDTSVVSFPLPDLRTHYFASHRGRFVWVAMQGNGRSSLPADLLKWATDDFHSDCSACYPFLFFDRRPFNWQGLYGGPEPAKPMIVSMTAMPYWSITIPLILLSAFLLIRNRGPIVWPSIKFWLSVVAAFVFAVFTIVMFSLPAVQQ